MHKKANNHKWLVVVLVLFVLGFFSIIVSMILGAFISQGSAEISPVGNVALIPIKGIITTQSGNTLFNSDYAVSSRIVESIENADSNPRIHAIVLEINSPGGSPVASDEIATAIKGTNKTVVAWIRELGASGGYYVASPADHIIAHKMSMTGSIGVIGSYLEYAELLDRYNVTYRRLVAGKYKDMGSPFKEQTFDESQKLQEMLDEVHQIFIDEVITNRRLDPNVAADIATGEVFLGTTALTLGLVDEVGGKAEVTAHLEDKLNTTIDYAEYREHVGLLDLLSEMVSEHSFFMGRGIGSALVESGTESRFSIKT